MAFWEPSRGTVRRVKENRTTLTKLREGWYGKASTLHEGTTLRWLYSVKVSYFRGILRDDHTPVVMLRDDHTSVVILREGPHTSEVYCNNHTSTEEPQRS